MVLTGPVRMSEKGHTRRRLLGTALGVTTLAGCGLLDDKPAPPAVPDPLRPLLDEALGLAATYERATVARPGLAARLAPLAADHRAHATELARVIGAATPSASAGPSGTGPSGTGLAGTGPSAAGPPAAGDAETLAALRTAEQAAQRNAAAACRQAAAARAALVGSIAACRATHVEALR
jgi:hypothetical protein